MATMLGPTTNSSLLAAQSHEKDVDDWLTTLPVVCFKTESGFMLEKVIQGGGLFRRAPINTVCPTYEGMNIFRLSMHKRDLWAIEWVDRAKRKCRVRCAGQENVHLYWIIEKDQLNLMDIHSFIPKPEVVATSIFSSFMGKAIKGSGSTEIENQNSTANVKLIQDWEKQCKEKLLQSENTVFELALHGNRISIRHNQTGNYLEPAKDKVLCNSLYRGDPNLFQICGKVGIVSEQQKLFLSASPFGNVKGGVMVPFGFETFIMGIEKDGYVSFRSFHRKYLTVETTIDGGFTLVGKPLTAESDAELFLLIRSPDGGRYIRNKAHPTRFWSLANNTIVPKQIDGAEIKLGTAETFRIAVLPQGVDHENDPTFKGTAVEDPEPEAGEKPPSLVFAVRIEDLVATEKRPVPGFVTACIAYLLKNNRFKEEGVFRLAGTKRVIDELRTKITPFPHDQNDVDGLVALEKILESMSEVSTNEIAGAFKMYFRELPEPLCTRNNYEKIVEIAQDSDKKKRHERYAGIIRRDFPKVNRLTLIKLMWFLNQVSLQCESNMMSSANLAIVFAPNILYLDEPGSFAGDVGGAMRVVQEMVDDYQQIFGAMAGKDC